MRHGHGRTRAPAHTAPAPSRIVDLNTAGANEIASLPGVSPRIAEAIVSRRPIRNWDDMKEVPGMSQGLIKQLRNSGVRLGLVARPT